MQSGGPICRLAARARRTSASGSSGSLAGCPTPKSTDATSNLESMESRVRRGSSRSVNLPTAATLFGWGTATTRDHKDTVRSGPRAGGVGHAQITRTDTLGQQAFLAGWATCLAGDAKSARNETANRTGEPPTGVHAGQTLVDQVTGLPAPGTATASYSAPTPGTGVCLNPHFSAWLMGYPAAWMRCLPPPATRSRKGPRGGSPPCGGSATRSSRKSRRRS